MWLKYFLTVFKNSSVLQTLSTKGNGPEGEQLK